MRSFASVVAAVVVVGAAAHGAAADTAQDPAWALYDRAYAALAHGDRAGARSLLEQLVATYPQHPAAPYARELVLKLRGPSTGPSTDPALIHDQDAEESSDKPSKAARGELVFWSTAASSYIGYNLCNIINCTDARETALTYTAVIGGALAASYLLSPNVHQGQAQLYNSAETWAAWTSLALFADDSPSKGVSAGAIAMQAAGVGVAAGLWEVWRPSRGDVALTNTAFIWGTLLGLYGQYIGHDDAGLRPTVLIGDAAIALGAVMSTQVHVSRGRTLLIDAGGVAGTLLGALLLAVDTPDSGRGVALELGIGTAVGLGIAAIATRDWDVPDLPNATVAPTALVDPATQKTTLGLGAMLRF